MFLYCAMFETDELKHWIKTFECLSGYEMLQVENGSSGKEKYGRH